MLSLIAAWSSETVNYVSASAVLMNCKWQPFWKQLWMWPECKGPHILQWYCYQMPNLEALKQRYHVYLVPSWCHYLMSAIQCELPWIVSSAARKSVQHSLSSCLAVDCYSRLPGWHHTLLTQRLQTSSCSMYGGLKTLCSVSLGEVHPAIGGSIRSLHG